MEIDPAKDRILIVMIQQDGAWGSPQGDAIVPTLSRLADDLVSSSTATATGNSR
jgi:hypothetical protein